MFQDFETAEIDTGGVTIFVRHAGTGPGLLLLHGFPETHLMWRDIAPRLTDRFTVVCADLRGYGRSSCPPSAPDHGPYAKRAMARDMIAVMAQLGFARFGVAGHDRGGRVAYRLALDHPDAVDRLAVLDIVPTVHVWEYADDRLATAFWPWSLLSQPAPLPERLIVAAPEAVVDGALDGWGSPAAAFPADVRAAYVDGLRDPARVHAICEEYRAGATMDRRHDEADRRAGRSIACRVLALWSASGAVGRWYGPNGGPRALWRSFAGDVRGHGVDGGHFFPEEQPEDTARALGAFFGEP